jgi:hypothetical protein
MLAPLTLLILECGQTNVTKSKRTMEVPWHWDKIHQKAFNRVKVTTAKEVVLDYLDYSKPLRFKQMVQANS